MDFTVVIYCPYAMTNLHKYFMKWAKTPIFKVGKIRFFFGFSTAVSPNQGLQLKKRLF